MIKYAVIGTGWISESFISGASAAGGLELAAVYSRSRERGEAFASKHGCKTVFCSLNELAKSGVDAVYIASPNSFHFSQSRLMLENGKHVICEKPITTNPAELEELQKLAAKNSLVYFEAIMYMHNPARALLRSALKEIGTITGAHFDFSQLSSKYPALKRGELPNIFNPEFATGCLMDLGIYCVYPAIDLFGMPESVSASSFLLSTGADSCGNAALNYKDKQVWLTYSKVGQSRLGSQIFGEEGTIVINSISQLTGMKIVYKTSNEKALTGEKEKDILMSYEAKSLVDFISGKAEKSFMNLCDTNAKSVSVLMEKIKKEAGKI